MNKRDFIKDIKNSNKGLRSGEIEGVIHILLEHDKGITFSDLITLTGLPKETIHVFKNSIISITDTSFSEGIKFLPEQIQILSEFDFKPYNWCLIQMDATELTQKLTELRASTDLLPKRELDQFFATEQTSAYKALIIDEKGLVADKNIALLGDDDLVSLTLEHLDVSPASIAAFDIDNNILNSINALSTTGIQTIPHDFRNDMPSLYRGQFDVVVTDPPYTTNGIKMFLNRALELLGPVKVTDNKYIFLYYGNSYKSPEKTIKIQDILVDMKLLIEDKLDKFARYKGAESIGNTSSLYILKVTPYSRKLELASSESIYTFEGHAEEKFPYVDHFVFKITHVDQKFLRSRGNIYKALDKFCSYHKLKVVDKIITEFKGGGLTVTYVLASSNMTVHTWPELGALHIDLITCTPLYNRDNLRTTLINTLGNVQIEIRKVE